MGIFCDILMKNNKKGLQGLLTVTVEDFLVIDETLEVIIDEERPDAGRGAGKEEIAGLQCEETGEIADDGVDGEEHLRGRGLLDGLSILIESEMELLEISEDREPVADDGTAIESFGNSPGEVHAAGLFLEITGCDIEAYRDSIIITTGETLGDGLAKTADTYHKLSFVINTAHIIRNKERFTILQESRVCLCENNRLGRLIGHTIKFLSVHDVVHADSKDFHDKMLLIFPAKLQNLLEKEFSHDIFLLFKKY